MMTRSLLAVALASLWLLPACDGSRSSAAPEPESSTPLTLAAGLNEVRPLDDAAARTVSVDTGRLQMRSVDRVYRVTTPVDTAFSFDVITQEQNSTGFVRVAVAHAADDGQTPANPGLDSLAQAGFLVVGTGVFGAPPWLHSYGDGFGRLTVTGKIQRPQVLAVETETTGGGIRRALVEIAIGPASEINRTSRSEPDHPGVIDNRTIYSSDSWSFGLPTVATSGDRTSVVTYEGVRDNPANYSDRYEMRMQYDRKTGKVTGGGSQTVKSDTGHWRDHEIAALYNVLAVVQANHDGVSVRLSFDRGATFTQTAGQADPSTSLSRLVQVAMAADYSLAVVYWNAGNLMLWEARPTAFDTHGSPTWYDFHPPLAIFQTTPNSTPLITGMTWSDGGDLVIGHAFTKPSTGTSWFLAETQFWCSVRPWGGEFEHCMLDKDVIVGRDPSVSVLGQGENLRIFYAYEGEQGIRLRVSEHGCKDFSDPILIGNPGAHTPTVFARATEQNTRVDLLYLTGGHANELHAQRWVDFGKSQPESYRLSISAIAPTTDPANRAFLGYQLTQVSWMGYDATLDGDEIVTVFDEETIEAEMFLHNRWGAWLPGSATAGSSGPLNGPLFRRGSPPPLAPGMTEPLPAPDPSHRHQLRLLRIQ